MDYFTVDNFARYWALLPEACSNLRGLHLPPADSTAGSLAPGQPNPLPSFYSSSGNLAGGKAFVAMPAAPAHLAIIAVEGIITRQSQAKILIQLQAALDNPSIQGIMFKVNSPGGIVAGTKELADFINQASKEKPCASYVDGLCASAAFWLAAATGKIYTPKTASIGSIGILAVHTDWSKFNENMGLSYTYITGGKFKASGNADNPLSEEDLKLMQQQITELHSIFKADIKKHLALSKSPELWGEGQVFLGTEAKNLGLASAIVQDFKSAIANFNAEHFKENFMNKQDFLANYPDLAAELKADFKAEFGAELKAELKAQLLAEQKNSAPTTATASTAASASVELATIKAEASGEVLGFVEALLGAEAKERVGAALQTGATVEQFSAIMRLIPSMAQAPAAGMSSTNAAAATQDSYAQKMLATLQAAHTTALTAPPQTVVSNALLADAEKRALEAKQV